MTNKPSKEHIPAPTRRDVLVTGPAAVGSVALPLITTDGAWAQSASEKGVAVRARDLSVSPKAVTVNSPRLSTEIARDNTETIKFLQSKLPALKPADLSIDSKGRLVITNSDVAKTINEMKRAGPTDERGNNIVCGKGC